MGKNNYEMSVQDSDWGVDSKRSKSCSPFTTALITIATSAVIATVVGVAVAFGRSCDTSENTTVAPTDSPTTEPPGLPGLDEVLLPTSLRPLSYQLTLRPQFYSTSTQDFMFNGSVVIHIQIVSPTREITIHKKYPLTIDESSLVVRSEGAVIRVQGVTYDERLEWMKVALGAELREGMGVEVEVKFSGVLDDNLAGLYYSYYEDAGAPRYLVTSHLHPTEARRVFPCLDEPALKASFTVTLEHLNTHTTFSNTNIEKKADLGEGWVADHYYPTPPMSTYLLAFVVSDFSCRTNLTSIGKEVHVCARPNAFDQTEYAANISARIQDFLEEYYNVTYPLNQTVHVAVPDFPAGAMENWGCILYRETSLLYDPLKSSTTNKQRVASVVAHELAHMWFGDLVTPGWWDDIWLNEGFASYMEYIGVNSVEPEWNMDDQFLSQDLHPVLQTDSLLSSHPIYQNVSHPNQINELFDSISYSKGASVIRMMVSFLGEEIFQAGITVKAKAKFSVCFLHQKDEIRDKGPTLVLYCWLRQKGVRHSMSLLRYLTEKSYSVTHHTDLFNTLTQVAEEMGNNVNVTEVMLTWILQMGYPVITMTYISATGLVDLNQTHFLTYLDVNATRPPSPYNYLWQAQVTLVTSNGSDYQHWLKSPSDSMTIMSDADWLIGNVNQDHYYRVLYDEAMWAALKIQLETNHTQISDADRAQLIDDSFSLARPGLMDQLTALDLSLYLDKEVSYIPWTAASRSFNFLQRMLKTTPAIISLNTYLQKQVQQAYNDVGWTPSDSDSHIDKLMRVQAVSLACGYGMSDCLSNASGFYKRLMSGESLTENNTISVDLLSSVYCYGISEGEMTEWNHAFNAYILSNTAAEQSMILQALACTQQSYILADYLSRAFLEQGIRRQDFTTVITSVASNRNGEQISWDLLRREWGTIYNRFGTTSLYALSNIVRGVTESFSTQQRLEELELFMVSESDRLGSAERAVSQSIESTRANVEWRRANEQQVTEWLQKQT